MHKVKSNKKLIVLLMVALVFAISICYTVLANAEEEAKMLPEENTAVEVDNATEQFTTATVPDEPRQAPVDIPSGDNQNENTIVFNIGFEAEEGGSVSAGGMRLITDEDHYILDFGSDNVVCATFPTEGWNITQVTPIPDKGYKFDAWYDNEGNKIEPGKHRWSSAPIFTAKFVEDEPTLVPIHVACDEQYLSDEDIWNLVETYDWTYNYETKTWSNKFSSDTTYASAMEGWKNVKPEKDGYIFKGFNPEPDDKHFLTKETIFNPIFEKSVKGKTITFITGDFKKAWGDNIKAVFYNEEGDTEQHYMSSTESGIFLTQIENENSTSVRFKTYGGPINKEIDAGEIPNVENPTFILTSEDGGEWYKEPEPPKPDPQPDPSSDTSGDSSSSNASGSAQTGDAPFAIAGLSLLALVAGAYVARRKLFN